MRERNIFVVGGGGGGKVVFVVLQCKLWPGWWLRLMQVSRKMIDETEARH